MSRYIDIETIEPRQYENSDVDLGVLAYDYDEMDAMPYIDIVFCKECKRKDNLTYYCDYHEHSIKPDDFCSYGERKE